jgi:thymidylate kinase
MPRNAMPTLISFSGIDGAGKSTQISALQDHLHQAGYKTRVIAFWDEVALLTKWRENAGHKLFKGEKGVGSPERPVNRRDKNVQTWYMVPIRFGLCLLDALGLQLAISRLQNDNPETDVVIFDRYLYDEIANLNLRNAITRAYVRLLLKTFRHPDAAFFLDADAAEARRRKPEYPIDFIEQNRAAYRRLSELRPEISLIHVKSIDATADLIWAKVQKQLSSPGVRPEVAADRNPVTKAP